MSVAEFMQELIQLAPALREAGVVKLGCGDKWVELAPAAPFNPAALRDEKDVEEEEEQDPLFDPNVKLRRYDATGEK